MALTALQRRICLLLAEQRRRSGESYVAGAAALNELLGSARLSHDVDLFHDTLEALAITFARDREALTAAGLTLSIQRESPSFVQARVSDGAAAEILQWVHDSAYRFFPLLEHATFGLTLHPFDHATNKILALAGRREPRDWVDAIHCHETLQPLGYLAWAASGKDPGLSPSFILEQAARTRYAQVELEALSFDGPAPTAAELSRRWHAALDEAREIVRTLPADHAGECVLDAEGRLLSTPAAALGAELAAGRVRYHEGRVRGAFPELRGPAR